MSEAMTEYDYDVIVIGSGFGGSVTALRLTEGLPRRRSRIRTAVESRGFPEVQLESPLGISASRCGCPDSA